MKRKKQVKRGKLYKNIERKREKKKEIGIGREDGRVREVSVSQGRTHV